MFELFSHPFIQRAFIGGILIGFFSRYYGVFVVQRGLSFLGSGLAHAAFGGVALGLLLRTEPLWIAVPFTILVALVKLDEGPMLTAQLTDVDPEAVEIGLPVEMVTRKLRSDGEEGMIVYGYKFRPLFETAVH